jgi:hypothetical protein
MYAVSQATDMTIFVRSLMMCTTQTDDQKRWHVPLDCTEAETQEDVLEV